MPREVEAGPVLSEQHPRRARAVGDPHHEPTAGDEDAADLAHFLASVQVNMDRFVAGQDACGGPIDLAVVHGLPRGAVTWLPGKTLRHPGDGTAPKVG